jgi:hypothetical protein
MSQDLEQESKLRQYLLGELNHEEQVLIEQRLFLESSYVQLAQAIEDDLVDDYLHDDLSAAERKRFESHFLSQTEHHVDFRIGEALNRYLTSDISAHPVTEQVVAVPREVLPLRNRRSVWFALAAAVLIVISIVAWIAIRSNKSPDDRSFEAHVPQPTPTEVPKQQPEPSQVNPNNNERNEVVERNGTDGSKRKSPNEHQPESTVFATILPNLTGRGEGESNEVTIPRTAKHVLLQIPVVTIKNYDKYRFELLSAGRLVDVHNLNVSVHEELGRIVSVLFPTIRLTQKRYEIRLRGLTADGVPGESTTYTFTIKKK